MRPIHRLYIFAFIIPFLAVSGAAFAQVSQQVSQQDRKQQISIPEEMMSSKEALVTKVQEISVREQEEPRGVEKLAEEKIKEIASAPQATQETEPKKAPAPQKTEAKRMYWEKDKRYSPRGNGIMYVLGSFFRETTSVMMLGSPDKNTKNTLKKSRGEYDLQKELGIIKVTGMPKAAPENLSLNDCIEIAVHNHLPLQTAKKSIRLAEMRVNEAKRNMWPSATIDIEDYNGQVYGRRYIGKKFYLEGQQPVYHGGGLYYTLKQAETNLEVARNDYRKTRNELVLQVKKAYYTLAKAKGNLVMQEELSRATDRIYDMVKKQLEANIISKLEYLNVSSQASQVKYQRVSAEGDAAVADLILKQAMNLEPGDNIDIEPESGFRKVEVDFSKALAAAYLARPEMRINLLMLDYHNYGQGVARAKQHLKVDLLGMWGLAKENYTSEDNWPVLPNAAETADGFSKAAVFEMQTQWYAGVKASMPFLGSTGEYSWTREQWVPVVSAYQGTEANTNSIKVKLMDKLDTYSEKQLAEIDYDKARQELVKIRQDVALEIKEGCFNYEKAIVQLETAANKVKYQERDTEFVKLRRSMGEAEDSNVVESMIKLAQERFGYLQALADCHTSLAAINKSIGREDFYKDEPAEKPE